MADQPRFIRVFLSSPGDVADERALALKVIENCRMTPCARTNNDTGGGLGR